MMKFLSMYFVRFCFVVMMLTFIDVASAAENQASTTSTQKPWVLKGVVTSDKGEALVGAIVVDVANQQSGAVTNLEGQFEIGLKTSNAEISVEYMGYKKQTLAVSSSTTNINVALESDGVDIKEVQVIAYGTQKKVTITGAVASIGTEEILQTPTTSMGNALAGRIPGLTSVQYSGAPGDDSPTLLVRGVSTFGGGSTAPLVLVDGVERDFSQLDPNEVDDITVLKDASATAVFGVRGANGVILVTTKRGEEGSARISVSTALSIQAPVKMLDFTNSADYAEFYNEAQMNDGVAVEDVRFSPELIEAFRTHSNPLLYPDIDWVDYTFKDCAVQTQTNINVSGGTERVRYFVSAGVSTQDGLLKTFDTEYDYNFNYNRYNYRANIDYDVAKGTKLAINIGGRVADKNRPIASTSNAELFRQIYRATPFDGAGVVEGKWIKTNPEFVPGVDATYSTDALDAFYGRGYYTNSNNVLNADMALTQDLNFITKGLKLNVKGAYNSSFDITKTRTDALATYMPVLTDNGEVGLRKSGADSELGYSESRGAYRNWYAEASLRYNRDFGRHHVSGLVLYNQTKSYYPGTYTGIPTGYVGAVGRITYDYDTRYLFDMNMGYNGSENFHEDRRYGVFPSASLGWVVTQESFMKQQKVISYLKIRGSYGVVGNDKTGASRYLYLPDAYGQGAWGYNFGTESTNWQGSSYEGQMGNEFVTWEKSYKQNYGVDASFFKSRLKLNVDYFRERREDIMLQRNNVPGHLAAKLPLVNYGVVENGGYEVVLGWHDNIGKVRYNISTNLSFARNKIIEMDEINPNEPYLAQTGQPVGQRFGYNFWGFYDETAAERYKAEFGVDMASQEAIGGASLQYGDCIYIDTNKDGVVNDDDKTAIGYTNNPQYSGATTLGLSYKNFSFSMMVNYAWNTSRQLAETFLVPLGSNGQYGLLQYHFDNRWTPETSSTATLPRATLSSSGFKNNYQNSDLWLVNSSYVRLKNVQLSYRVNSKRLENIGVRNLDVTLSGYNLLTFTSFKLNDPESLSNASTGYPVMKVFNLGLRIGF